MCCMWILAYLTKSVNYLYWVHRSLFEVVVICLYSQTVLNQKTTRQNRQAVLVGGIGPVRTAIRWKILKLPAKNVNLVDTFRQETLMLPILLPKL
jgi:hypothetical protein